MFTTDEDMTVDYEGVREALGLPKGAKEWDVIKSAGRQGVARAFQEGGRKKAEKKLAKVLAAASVGPSTGAIAAQAQKKRRRRSNERERVIANKCGVLTDRQLFLLFAHQHDNWERMRCWRDDPRVERSKLRQREGWAAEFLDFCHQFGDHYKGEVTDTAPALFVATTAQALQCPPDEAAAARLWAVLSREDFEGVRLGSIAEVPLGADNVGRRMLLALGWQPGTGLGMGGGGIVEPIAAASGSAGTGGAHRGLGFSGRHAQKRRRTE